MVLTQLLSMLMTAGLNWDRGDLQSAAIKTTIDLMRVLAIGRFHAHLNAIPRLRLDSNGGRSRTGNWDLTLSPIQFVTSNFLMHLSPMMVKLVGMPYQLKVGRQVINWGESTFVLGGNSVFNPIDVSAFAPSGR